MYETFEHGADIGIRGIGDNLEEAFIECAKAMFDVMVDIKNINPQKLIKFKIKAHNEKELLVEFLNNLLTQADLKNMVFSKFDIIIKNDKILKSRAWGEEIDPLKHCLKTEVKAATYSMLKVEKKNNKYIAQCVIDV